MRNALFCLLSAMLLLSARCSDDNKKGPNELRIRIEAEASVLNPYMPSPGYSRFVSANLFQTLGAQDPLTLELKPVMVERIPTLEQVTDGPYKGMLRYAFEIREAAKWDDGKPVTARDVEFTLKTIFNPYLPTQPWRGYFETLKAIDIDAQNERKFTAYFDKYYLLALESMCQVPILPAHIYDVEGKNATLPLAAFLDQSVAKTADTLALKAYATVFQDPKFSTDPKVISGSGAYKVESVTPGEAVVLVRKPNYWANGIADQMLAAYPERISYRVIKDEAAIENMMRNQDLDLGVIINTTKFLEMQKDAALTANYDLTSQPTFNFGYWMLNTRNPILQDKAVRKALAQLVNYDYLFNEVYQQMAERTIGPINPSKPYYNKDVKPYTFDVSAAAQQLEAAGWKDTDGDGVREKMIAGKKTPLALKIMASSAGAVSAATAASIQTEARKAGVQIEIDNKDINSITKETRAGNFETAILAAATFSGFEDLYQLYHSNSMAPRGDNRSAYASARADSLIVAIRGNADATTRNEQYKQLQAVISDDAPHIFLFVPRLRTFVHKRYEPVLMRGRPGYVESLFQLK